MKKLITAVVVAIGVAACQAEYPSELALCNEIAKTLCDSIRCENQVRLSHGRPPREMPPACIDGGKDAGHE